MISDITLKHRIKMIESMKFWLGIPSEMEWLGIDGLSDPGGAKRRLRL
jgi:hypothetical protein